MKKWSQFKNVKNNVLSNEAFWPTRTHYIEHGVFFNMFEMTLTFPLGGHVHGRHMRD